VNPRKLLKGVFTDLAVLAALLWLLAWLSKSCVTVNVAQQGEAGHKETRQENKGLEVNRAPQDTAR